MVPHNASLAVTADTLRPGTSLRYHHRNGSSLATVTERTDERITFVGEDCDGQFTHDQIAHLLAADRIQVVLDDQLHVPADVVGNP